MEVSGQLHAPADLLPEKSPCYPLHRGGQGLIKLVITRQQIKSKLNRTLSMYEV